MRMTKQEFEDWLWKLIENDSADTIRKWVKNNYSGTAAEMLIDELNQEFIYGVECGMLIARNKIFTGNIDDKQK